MQASAQTALCTSGPGLTPPPTRNCVPRLHAPGQGSLLDRATSRHPPKCQEPRPWVMRATALPNLNSHSPKADATSSKRHQPATAREKRGRSTHALEVRVRLQVLTTARKRPSPPPVRRSSLRLGTCIRGCCHLNLPSIPALWQLPAATTRRWTAKAAYYRLPGFRLSRGGETPHWRTSTVP